MANTSTSRFNKVIRSKARETINGNGVLYRCLRNSQQNACSHDLDAARVAARKATLKICCADNAVHDLFSVVWIALLSSHQWNHENRRSKKSWSPGWDQNRVTFQIKSHPCCLSQPSQWIGHQNRARNCLEARSTNFLDQRTSWRHWWPHTQCTMHANSSQLHFSPTRHSKATFLLMENVPTILLVDTTALETKNWSILVKFPKSLSRRTLAILQSRLFCLPYAV
jgi:hypothetical protein